MNGNEEYLIAGVQEKKPTGISVYKVGADQLQGMFVTMYRRYFGDSHPKSYIAPEDILKEVEAKGKFRIVLNTKEDGKLIFIVKRADKADWPYGYGDIDFGKAK